MTERAPDDLADRILRLSSTHAALLLAMVKMDACMAVPHFLERADIQASYLSAASEARALYAAQCDTAKALRASCELLTPDQQQVLVVVEFDLARLAKSLGGE